MSDQRRVRSRVHRRVWGKGRSCCCICHKRSLVGRRRDGLEFKRAGTPKGCVYTSMEDHRISQEFCYFGALQGTGKTNCVGNSLALSSGLKNIGIWAFFLSHIHEGVKPRLLIP